MKGWVIIAGDWMEKASMKRLGLGEAERNERIWESGLVERKGW